MKGIVFSTDAIIAVTLGLLLLSLIPLTFESGHEEASFQALSYQANDLLSVLETLTVSDISQKPTVSSLIAQGIIKDKDLNKTVLDLIGTFWYSGNESIARNITKEVLENLTNKCFKLEVGNETVYSSNCPESNTVAVAFRTASGYEIGKPVAGYIARAWATKVVKNITQTIPFYPEGAGWTANQVEITKKFSLPTNITIYDAILYVSVHFGTSQSQAEFQQLVVNGVQKKNDVVWLYLQEEKSGSEVTTAAYGYVNVKNELVAGNNSIYLKFGTPNYNAHVHPGMRLVVTYSLTQDVFTANTTFRKRYYFDDVIGRTGAWSMISFYIPENAKNVSARLKVNAKRVDDTQVYIGGEWRNSTDVKVYVNSNTTFYADGDNEYCYSYTDKGYYCVRDIAGVMNPRLDFDITSKLVNGTNVVSVYLNSYGDIHWGYQDSEIYSDPINDPENSSYIEVYYELPEPPFYYGEIDITKDKLFGYLDCWKPLWNASNPKNCSFNISENEKRITESFVHIAQGFSSMIKTYAWFDNLPQNLVFVSPAIRAVPESVYIKPSIWNVGENNIALVDFQPGGSISDTNYILPWSSFEYTYLAKSMVGYGSVFNSSDAAVNDAIERLKQQIGAEGINATNIQVDSKSVYGIEWLWGPSLFKLYVW